MKFRRVSTGDFEQILQLQRNNLIWELGPDRLDRGFLATSFSLEQFHEMDRTGCVVVCEVDGKVHGYLCGSTAEFNRSFKLPSAMLTHCSTLLYNGKPVGACEYFVASPICIDRDYHRPVDVYHGLSKKLLELIDSRYEVGLTFISTTNHTSLNAAKKRASEPLEIIGHFRGEDTEEGFWILAFSNPGFQLKARSANCTSEHQ